MTGPDLDAIRARMRTRDADELKDIVAYQREGFLPEVIQIAEDELMTRGYTGGDIEALRCQELNDLEEREEFFERALARIGVVDEADECHLCTKQAPTLTIGFGLAAVVEDRTEVDPSWVALSLVTLPLVGAALFMRRQMEDARLIPLRLRLCDECGQAKRWLGKLDLSEDEYRRHPAWSMAQELGFDRFVDAETLRRMGS